MTTTTMTTTSKVFDLKLLEGVFVRGNKTYI